MKFSIECFFQSDPSLGAEKQGLGLKFSIENEIFEPRMKISSENDFFVRVGMVFSSDRARMNFFDLWALWAALGCPGQELHASRLSLYCFRQGMGGMSRDLGRDRDQKNFFLQQLTYGVVSEGFLAESLRKFCRNSAESSRKLRQERVRKFCGKFAEISRKFAENFLQ